MVFGWLYAGITQATITGMQNFFSDEENIKQLTALADAMVDREMQRVYGKIGGTMKGVNAGAMPQLPQIMKRDGSLNFKGILGSLLQGKMENLLGGMAPGSQSPSPEGDPSNTLNFRDRLKSYG